MNQKFTITIDKNSPQALSFMKEYIIPYITFLDESICKNHTDFVTNSSSSGGFLKIMREFIPLDEIGEEKASQLFDSDMESGKFTCNVYMDRTD